MMAAEEASLSGGLFEKILQILRALAAPRAGASAVAGGFCAILSSCRISATKHSARDLLPAMDEGGFVLDYVMPPGSSLQETNRVISHVERIVRAMPEVESTSRRTGLQLGLAAVTEPNTGDIAVKLKDKRSRGIDDVISEVRAKVKTQEPALDVDFMQVLQDMIGDLTGAPQPVVVQAFSPMMPICWRRGRRAWRMRLAAFTSIIKSRSSTSKTASKTRPAVRRSFSPSIRRQRPGRALLPTSLPSWPPR